MTLIERLKNLQNNFPELSDYKFSIRCIEVLPEIIQTLERKEKEISRKDKLLAEARILLEHVWVNGRNSICDYRDHEPADCPSEACLAREWLAAFSKETNEEQV